MTALPSRPAASYQVGTSFFLIYPMGEYVFSMWCKFGTTMLCTQKIQTVFISRVCLHAYGSDKRQAVVNLCDVIYDAVGYYFSHCHYHSLFH